MSGWAEKVVWGGGSSSRVREFLMGKKKKYALLSSLNLKMKSFPEVSIAQPE